MDYGLALGVGFPLLFASLTLALMHAQLASKRLRRRVTNRKLEAYWRMLDRVRGARVFADSRIADDGRIR